MPKYVLPDAHNERVREWEAQLSRIAKARSDISVERIKLGKAEVDLMLLESASKKNMRSERHAIKGKLLINHMKELCLAEQEKKLLAAINGANIDDLLYGLSD